jgi:hypothetical protein
VYAPEPMWQIEGRRKKPGDAALPHLVVVVQLLALLTAGPVSAEPNADERALALFHEGRALLLAGRLGEACPKLEASQRLAPSGGKILNLALCHEQAGLLARSWGEFQEAITFARREGRSDREQAAESHIRAVEPRLSRLTISVPEQSRVEGLRIEHDGRELVEASWSKSVPVDGGEHLVRATAPGRRPFATTLRIASESDLQSVEIPLLEAEEAPITPSASLAATALRLPASLATPRSVSPLSAPEPTVDASGTKRAIAWTVGAAGLAQWGAAGYFGIRAFQKNAEADSECPNGQCTSRGITLGDQAGRAATTATVLSITGFATVATSVFLLLTSPKGPVRAAVPRAAARVDLQSSGSTVVVRGYF